MGLMPGNSLNIGKARKPSSGWNASQLVHHRIPDPAPKS